MSLPKSRRIFGEKNKKTRAKKSKGLFVEAYAVAPAPSRDYYALQLFQKKFLLTKWRICHGPLAAPTQTSVFLENYKRNATLQHEITYIFGDDVTNLINDLANENWSLTSMPSNILQKIFSYLAVSDILRLSQVCKRLSKECSSNELWKTICKKQWKILIHNDIEKASLIGWKTVYLEKMRPKRYKMESGHQGHHPRPHLRSKPISPLSRIQSVSTLNTPDHRGSTAKSNLTIHKRELELKRSDPNRSTSEIFGKNFKVTSTSTGKSTERTYTVSRAKVHSKELRPTTGEKLLFTPRKCFPQSSSSTLNLTNALNVGSPIRQKPLTRATSASAKPSTAAAPPIRSKVTSIRTYPQKTTPSVQSTTDFIGGTDRLQNDRVRVKSGKPIAKK